MLSIMRGRSAPSPSMLHRYCYHARITQGLSRAEKLISRTPSRRASSVVTSRHEVHPASTALVPSSAESGYILSLPKLENPFTSDPSFRRVLAWYLPRDTLDAIRPRLTKFADEAISEQINEWVSNAEKQVPYVKTHNVWGKRYPYDRLVTSQGWKELGKWGQKNGVVALGYEEEFGPYRRIVQHAHNYIYSASSAVYSCPISMTSGAARLFKYHYPELPTDHPFQEILSHITARENPWTSAQWMTERPGGSDVQNSETVATYSPLPAKTGEFGKLDEGDYLISGFKFFSSATDSQVAFMLAKTESGKLSLFVAPQRKTVVGPDGQETQVSNGVRIHRLKNKYGTKELPTAELELKDVRAHLVGPLDRGIPTIAALLNVTRSHNFITALSCWRRGMAIAKSFAKVRTTIDQPLWTFPMHLRLLGSMEVKHAGALQLCFFTTSLLGFQDNGFPQNVATGYAPLPHAGEEAKVVHRTLTATAKAVVCKVSTVSLNECQEAMGGVGYMDEPDEPEHNISRLMRDSSANMIWEGTTNVLASEVVRNLLNKNNLDIFGNWMNWAIGSVSDDHLNKALRQAWSGLQQKLVANRDDIPSALADGRQTMFTLSWITSGMLLSLDAQRDGDEVALETARRWVLDGDGGVGEYVFPDIVYDNARRRADTRERANWDCRLVWGVDLPADAAAGYRVAAVKNASQAS